MEQSRTADLQQQIFTLLQIQLIQIIELIVFFSLQINDFIIFVSK